MIRPILFLLVLGFAIYLVVREVFAEGAKRARRLELEAQMKAREKEVTTEHGGSPEHPILVPSPSVVEAEAAGQRCARCGAEMRFEEHAAEAFGEQRLRVARLKCPQCGAERALYFQIGLLS